MYIYIYIYKYVSSFLLPGKTSCDSKMQVGDEQNTYEWFDQSQYKFASYQACVVQTVFFKATLNLFVRKQVASSMFFVFAGTSGKKASRHGFPVFVFLVFLQLVKVNCDLCHLGWRLPGEIPLCVGSGCTIERKHITRAQLEFLGC